MFSIILTALIVGAIVAIIRMLASAGTVWGFFPANTFGLVTTKSNEATEADAVGGGIVGILHSIPGRYLDKSDHDPMQWEIRIEDPDHKENRGLFYHLIGVEYLGGLPFTRSLRLNKIHQIRYSRKDGETDYTPTAKDFETKFVHFSGNLTVLVKSAETAGIFALDLNFNLNYERVQPLKSVIRVPDVHAVLTQMVREAVIAITSAHKPEHFLGGKEAKNLQNSLVLAIEDVRETAKIELGIWITKATLESISADTETKKILELNQKTKRENQALIAVAKAKAKALIATNEADAHRVREVILPQANAPGAAAIRFAEAYEKNDAVTVFAPGGNLSQIIPSVERKPEKQKAGFQTEDPPAEKKK